MLLGTGSSEGSRHGDQDDFFISELYDIGSLSVSGIMFVGQDRIRTLRGIIFDGKPAGIDACLVGCKRDVGEGCAFGKRIAFLGSSHDG